MSKELYASLESLLDILEEETQALVDSDGARVNEILDEKMRIMEDIDKFQGQNFSQNAEIVELIEKIDDLQETNLMLTQQALNYNETFLKIVTEGLEEKATTYSASGDMGKTTSSLIDRSI